MEEYRRKVIGEIDGITVYGQYYNDDGKPSVVVLHWKSWQVKTDGVSLWFPTTGEEVGHMRVTDWWRIKEMAQAGILDPFVKTTKWPK